VPTLTGIRQVELIAQQTRNLDTICYRGEALLAHLALISEPDVFDQVSNPDGLQRDLSPKHAADAYDYASRPVSKEFPRAFPELVLNVRDKRAVEIEPLGVSDEGTKLYRLAFEVNPDKSKIRVSRVDGNHRLWYAAGDDRRQPLNAYVPFQIHVGLTRDQERSLFVDINANQKGLNTSHLAIMKNRLTPEEREILEHPERWMANRLVEDPASPWHGLVHLGGSKKGARAQGLTRPVNFTSLLNGVAKLITKSQYIHDLTEPQAQYIVVRNYWTAVKQVFAEEWSKPKDFLLLRNMGVWSLALLGGTIVDRCMARGRADILEMARYLGQARTRFDWGRDATGDRAVSGMSGNRAALIIAGEMARELTDEAGEGRVRELQAQLLGGA
jgi:DGQHR domain-containing protein